MSKRPISEIIASEYIEKIQTTLKTKFDSKEFESNSFLIIPALPDPTSSNPIKKKLLRKENTENCYPIYWKYQVDKSGSKAPSSKSPNITIRLKNKAFQLVFEKSTSIQNQTKINDNSEIIQTLFHWWNRNQQLNFLTIFPMMEENLISKQKSADLSFTSELSTRKNTLINNNAIPSKIEWVVFTQNEWKNLGDVFPELYKF